MKEQINLKFYNKKYTSEPYPGIPGNLSTPDKSLEDCKSVPVSTADNKLVFRIILHKKLRLIRESDFADKGGKVTCKSIAIYPEN